MLISKIYGDFQEVNEILAFYKFDLNNGLFHLMCNDHAFFTLPALKRMNGSVRSLSKVEGALEQKRFQAEITRKYVEGLIKSIKCFLKAYDELEDTLEDNSSNDRMQSRKRDKIDKLKTASKDLYGGYIKIISAKELLEEADLETWEPIPEGIDEDKMDVIIISSATQGGTLGDIAKDIACIDGFFRTASQLIDADTKYFLRKIETGSLQIIVSCIEKMCNLVFSLFHYAEICRKRNSESRERYLQDLMMELEIANKILEIDPGNKEAKKIVQKCGEYMWEFMQRNPIGSVNGKTYDIEKETPMIEQKDES